MVRIFPHNNNTTLSINVEAKHEKHKKYFASTRKFSKYIKVV